jgi:hypothetical protein
MQLNTKVRYSGARWNNGVKVAFHAGPPTHTAIVPLVVPNYKLAISAFALGSKLFANTLRPS